MREKERRGKEIEKKNFFFFFFFFEAEDGIRDFCLSRGLGDVHKRQVNWCALRFASYHCCTIHDVCNTMVPSSGG